MRLKLFLLLALAVCLPMLAQQTGVRGVVIDNETGVPVSGATVLLDEQGVAVTTGPSGDFVLTGAKAGADRLLIFAYGYRDFVKDVAMFDGGVADLGELRVAPTASPTAAMDEERRETILSESDLEDEEGSTQSVSSLVSTSNDPYYRATSFNFSAMRFRLRGYNQEYSQTYINGINFNDAARGRFSYSMLGGMNQAFRSRSTGMGLENTSFAFGDIGGASNIMIQAKDYSPGFRGSVAYTNSNYYLRGMVTYSTGLSKTGWALTVSAVGRYANEGVIPGSFYNSWGYFVALQKVFNPQHSLSLVTFGAPTKRASNSATFEEAYQLAGSHLYNTNWGWQEGKKRNARVVESYDPTAILNWIWTPSIHTTLNTGVAFHKSFYSSSAINWYNAADPRPDYYRYLPSYYAKDQEVFDRITYLWENDESRRQVNWDQLYQTNYLNNDYADKTGQEKGSTYILENRHSNQFNWALNSYINTRLSKLLTLQGGVSANYSRSSYYKTIKDLLGGRFWTDVDQFSERDFPGDGSILQNDMEHPNRKVQKGDRFGYDYNINSVTARAWIQNTLNFARWDINYGAQLSYTTFQRDGHMRNGRAPENSLGKGKSHSFVNYAFKAGAVFKINGRNNIVAHAYYGTRAPQYNNAYVSPRIKDDVIADLKSERILSGDIGYIWNYRRFMGSITGFWTEFWDMTERTSFYDDVNSTFMNYALTGVQKEHKGIEFGAAFKATPSITLNASATFSRYQYKNRPTGTRSFENGAQPDVTQTVYLKNYYVSGTPQEAYSLGINWQAPHSWFFEATAVWMNRAYVDLSPVRHEIMPELYKVATTELDLQDKIAELAKQDKLNEAFVVNLSIGKFIRLSRGISMNLNLNINNLFDNRNIQTGGYQQGRLDTKDLSNTTTKFPNKYYYGQGFRLFLNAGIRF